jgi:integrase
MSKKRFKPSHLERRYNTYFTTLVVPKDVRHIIGKSKFFETTHTGDLRIAESQATLKVIKWKAEIAEARTKTDDPILNSAIELNRLLKTRSSPRHLVEDVIEEETYRIEKEVGGLISRNFSMIATGKSKVLKTLIPDWRIHQKRKNLADKTIAQMEKDIDLMVDYLSTTYVLTEEHANIWIRYVAQHENLSAGSVTRIIGGCRNFFQYLKDVNVVPENSPQPFTILKEFKVSKNSNSKSVNKTESWEPFEVEEVSALHAEAIKKGDQILADLISLGAYTGARIEELCSLEKTYVKLEKKSLKIVDSKTKSGEREIPIHSALLPLVKKMMRSNDDPKYLIPNLTLNKYGDRSNAVGKRFGRLKDALGHTNTHVFHSIRKTFTTALENAGVTENVAADIVGHKKQTMTYGLYSGGTTLDVKRKAIERINYGPKFCTTTT